MPVFFRLARKKSVTSLDMLWVYFVLPATTMKAIRQSPPGGKSCPYLHYALLNTSRHFWFSFHIVEASFCRHSPGHCIPSCVWASTRPTGGPESFHPDDPEPRLPAATGTHTATSCKNRKNKMCQIQVRPVSWVKPARMDKGYKTKHHFK